MARTVSIRTSLLATLLVAILGLSTAIVLTTLVGAREAVRDLSGRLIKRQLGEIDAHLQAFFDPAQDGLRVAASWGRAGLLDLKDPRALREIFQPFIEQYPQVSSLMVADERGAEFMLLRLPGRWRNRMTRRDDWGDRVEWTEWTDEKPEPTVRHENLDYHPRSRPWFIGAREAAKGERVHWTKPYSFFTTRDPGITASIAFEDPAGKSMVLGFDILLRDISNKTISLGDKSQVFVLTDEGKVIGLPSWFGHATEERRRQLLLKPPADLGLQVIDDAIAIPDTTEPVRFLSGGDAWWGDQETFRLGSERTFDVAVLVQEAQLLSRLDEIRGRIAWITAAVLVAAVLGALLLARRFSRPIEQLVRESDRISRGHLEPGRKVQAKITELHQLADAQDRMRASLEKLFKLEGDLRIARQIQQNTWPLRLPVLEGFDLVAWSQPADETGGDSYDVVGIWNGAVSDRRAQQAVLLLADATGHGIGPALSVTQVRAMLRMAVRTGQGLAEIAGQMNDQLCEDLEAARFVTAWFGLLDATKGTITTFSAGQGPLLRYEAAKGAWHEMGSDMPPLGIMSGTKVEINEPIALESGDLYVVLSDGFFEASNAEGEMFESRRVIDVLSSHLDETAERMLHAVREAVDEFTGGAPLDDDRTAIIIKKCAQYTSGRA